MRTGSITILPGWRPAGRRIGLLLLLGVALAGCATLSPQQCRSGDWKSIGRDDGERGLGAGQLDRHREACTGEGVRPDAAAWRAGYDEGLAEYCTEAGGYVAGRSGGSYGEVCPAATEAKFLEALGHGHKVERALRDLKDLRRRADELERAVMSGTYGQEERTLLRYRWEELSRRVRRAQWDLERLDQKYAREHGAPELGWAEMR